jgi:hypothetical protein
MYRHEVFVAVDDVPAGVLEKVQSLLPAPRKGRLPEFRVIHVPTLGRAEICFIPMEVSGMQGQWVWVPISVVPLGTKSAAVPML